MLLVHVHHVAEPVADEPVTGTLERGFEASAAEVAADDHVLDAENVDGVLEHGEAVEIGVDDDGRYVAVDKDLSSPKPHDLVGRDAAIGAADLEVLGTLSIDEALVEVRIAREHSRGPGAIVLGELGEGCRAERLSRGST